MFRVNKGENSIQSRKVSFTGGYFTLVPKSKTWLDDVDHESSGAGLSESL